VAEAVNVCVLKTPAGTCTVSASLVRGVANTMAAGDGSSFSSIGSAFKDLVVNGAAMNNVNPNTTIDISVLFGAGSFVKLYEESGTTSRPPDGTLSGGTFAADVTVNMIRVHATDRDPLTAGNQTADIVVSHVTAHSDFPQTTLCAPVARQSVSGHAFIASETTNPAVLPVVVGFASIPTTGGHGHQHLDTVMLPADGSVVSSAAADSDSTGTLGTTSSTATSTATATDVCVLRMSGVCTVSATSVRSQSNSTANAGGASADDAGTQLLNVVVTGAPPIATTPAPNTVIPLDGIGFVVLNEQFCDGSEPPATPGAFPCTGSTSTGRTVQAIHVVITVPDNPTGLTPGAEIIVAEAHSDARFIA
jgi:hypothetical protein